MFPIKGLLGALTEYARVHACLIDSRVYHFAAGLDFNNNKKGQLHPPAQTPDLTQPQRRALRR